MASAFDWLIYLCIFIIGYLVGKIITTIQYGLRFNNNAKKARKEFVKKYEPKKRRK